MKTHYDTLGISKTASATEIRTAYRKLALLHHPDSSTNPKSTELFIEIAEAYRVLSDSELRSNYDTNLKRREEAARNVAQPKPAPKARPATPAGIPAAELIRLTNLLKRNSFAEAEKLAKRLQITDPRHPMPYAVQGDIAAFRGNLKRAAEMYAYATQMDPKNPVYERKHAEVIHSIQEVPAKFVGERTATPTAVWVAVMVIALAATYVIFARDKALLPGMAPISSWNLSLMVMLFLSGVTVGASLCVSGLVGRFAVTHSSATMRMPPTVVLGFIAIVNFWAAAALYWIVGLSQEALNSSTSRLVGSVAAISVLMWMASVIQSAIAIPSLALAPWQVLIWGGNLTYFGALGGWMVADAVKHGS